MRPNANSFYSLLGEIRGSDQKGLSILFSSLLLAGRTPNHLA